MGGWLARVVLCSSYAIVAIGCARSERPSSQSSETHFLHPCDRDADCEALGPGHACVAGRCRVSAGPALRGAAGAYVPEPRSDAAGAGGSDAGAVVSPDCGSGCFDGTACRDLGERWQVDCNECWCDGSSVYCTLVQCKHFPPCEPLWCELYGECISPGSSPFVQECDFCSCISGEWSCAKACEVGVHGPVDVPPCYFGSCEYQGVCYPDGATTEDGCCKCGGGAMSCGDAGSCRPPEIGRRCTGDGDCSPGLVCREDFSGERAVCTRSCNYGCPTGSECVEAVPDHQGGTIRDICMRPCASPDDCGSLGSICDAPGGGGPHCF